MRTAFAQHVLRADPRLVALRAVLLSLSLVPAFGTASAVANTTGGAAATTATATPSEPAASETASSGGAAPSYPQQTSKPTLATWFGPGFYGNRTACGQTMSATIVGVASRTLPCGTLVQIGYRGRHLTVPVIDRGPYGHIGAVWDLTAGTARALKIKETVRVTTEIVGSLPNTPTLGQPEEAGLPGTEAAPTSSSASATSAAAASTGGAAAAS